MTTDEAARGTNLPLWLVAFLMITGTLFVGSRRTEPPTPPPATESKHEDPPRQPTETAADPLLVLKDYFRMEPDSTRQEVGTDYRLTLGPDELRIEREKKKPGRLPLSDYLRRDPKFHYECLIVTVPDPLDSKFALEFDSTVEAVQRAFEARGFILHSSWLPWPRGSRGQAERSAQPLHREYPGSLLFRKTRERASETPVLSVVCLVGENPISGPHKPALARALDLYEELIHQVNVAGAIWAAEFPKETIRIIGPYYSGSQAIMMRTLELWRAPLPPNYVAVPPEPERLQFQFNVVSGSASALSPELIGKFPGTFQATVIPNHLITQAVTSYLSGGRNADLHENLEFGERVAVLRESNTRYGALSRSVNNEIDLPFPISISQLQANLEKQRTPAPLAGLPQTGFVEPRLLVHETPQLDGLAPYDPESAVALAGQSLRSILTTIDRARVRYVGIVATDVRDVVFLNKLLRRECPNVRVFTTEPSVALLHPDEAYHLRGMIVGSTYPLYPPAAWWTRLHDPNPSLNIPSRIPNRRLSFPTQGAQGIFNAVLALSKKPELMLGYSPLLFPDAPVVANRPPIWISVIGQNGQLVPVHCYANYSDSNPPLVLRATYSDSGLHREKPSIGVPFGLMLGQLGAVFVLGAVLSAACRDEFWREGSIGRLHGEEEQGHQEAVASRFPPSWWIWFLRHVLLAAVLLFALPHTLPTLEILAEACCRAINWRQWFALYLAILILAEVVALLFVLLDRARISTSREERWGYLGLASLSSAATILTWSWWCNQSTMARFLLYVRATSFSAGLSPLVPMGLLAAAAFVVAWCLLQQAELCCQSWIECPYQAPWSEIKTEDEKLKGAFRQPFRGDWSRTIWLVLGIPYLACAFWNMFVIPLPSEEGPLWDWTLRLAFWATVGGVVFTLSRFLILWSGLRKLLGEILRVPMVGAFERMPDEIGRLFGGYLYSQRPHLSHLAAAAWALPATDRGALADEIAAAPTSEPPGNPRLGWIFGKPEHPGPHGDEERDRQWLATRLHDKAAEFLKKLPDRWLHQSMDDAFGESRPRKKEAEEKAPERQPTKPPRKPLETREMESFVACLVVLYLGHYFAQLRMLVYAFAFAAPLLLFAAASYPFQPDRVRLDALVGLVLVAAIGTMYVLYRINRDGLVSRITRTTPDRFTPDAGFFASMMTYVVPLLAIVLAQVFGLFRFLLEPILGLFQ